MYKLTKKKIENKIEYFVNEKKVDRFELLATVLEQESKKDAWELMRIASTLFHPQNDPIFNNLYEAVTTELTIRYSINEFTIHDAFTKNICTIFKGKAKEIKNKKNNNKHIPDVWIEFDNEEVPVEIKLNTFDNKAINQLKRYMQFYNCKRGIAVGTSCTETLPENIIFIPINSFFDK